MSKQHSRQPIIITIIICGTLLAIVIIGFLGYKSITDSKRDLLIKKEGLKQSCLKEKDKTASGTSSEYDKLWSWEANNNTYDACIKRVDEIK